MTSRFPPRVGATFEPQHLRLQGIGEEKWLQGTLVLAKFKAGAEWYPAQVMSSTGNLVTVQYGGGAQDSLPSALISNLTWLAGTYIECKLSTGRAPVTIVSIRPGFVLDVVSNAGKKMTLAMQACRSAPALH